MDSEYERHLLVTWIAHIVLGGLGRDLRRSHRRPGMTGWCMSLGADLLNHVRIVQFKRRPLGPDPR